MLRSVALMIVGIALLGAGCQPSDRGSNDVDKVEASAFIGLDGSLTEYAFDDVAERFTADQWRGRSLTMPQISPDEFALWLTEQKDAPVTDTFGNPIQMRVEGPWSFVLWTVGEDGREGTQDDYSKLYGEDPQED